MVTIFRWQGLSKQLFNYYLLQEFAPHYFAYVTDCHDNGHRTLLAKILGVFTVGYRNSSTGKSLKIDVLVIENIFYKYVVIMVSHFI